METLLCTTDASYRRDADADDDDDAADAVADDARPHARVLARHAR